MPADHPARVAAGRAARAVLPGRPTGGRAAPADLPPPDHAPHEAREAADAVLARPEYQWDGGDGLIERVGDWITDQLDRGLSQLGFSLGGLPTWAGWLIIAALVALVAVMVYRSQAGWRRDRRVGERSRVVVTGGEPAVDWAAEVARCESEGRWREALRARYRVLVGDLASRGVIGDLAGRTAGELVVEVRGTAPAVAPSFAGATALFESVWYGGAPAGPAERDRFARLAGEARAAAGLRVPQEVGA